MADHPDVDVHALLAHTCPAGATDSITDVDGVEVGQTTVTDGREIHSGVTAVVPRQLDESRKSLPCNVFVGNGHGKLIGATQISELGDLETPIVLTSTLSAFRAADALVTWMLRRPGHEATISLNPVVGECNDGWLSDIRTRPVREEHVLAALDNATGSRPEEGAVGAGTGMRALGFKGGIGTASRAGGDHVVGVLVQTNFSGTLTIRGRAIEPPAAAEQSDHLEAQGNSCMIVVATDAPVDARQLGRMARRAVYAMGRLGADYRHGSGDYAIAFSSAEPTAAPPDPTLDALFTATIEATEAAILHSLLQARTTTGRAGRTAYGLTAADLAASPASAGPRSNPGRTRRGW
ncbi:P1 family peptidase [Luteipulveratus mongoliensis]|uniref:D-aminopeptidase n=1 Tax=Luteipulveratus mongoliensis TaxID=571913 RepID=A0A0K1JHW1_9MICO|nr:P1 family peptidase [Luteipulveratus mongoliensis]AKU16302.1 hypothetical protein VV02_11230 [Luteipulveratus mongoliensis]